MNRVINIKQSASQPDRNFMPLIGTYSFSYFRLADGCNS